MPPGPIEDVTQEVHKVGESLIVELPFRWIDFGTFESLSKYLKDKGMYKPSENIVEIDAKDNFVMLDDPNKIVALINVENLVIVDTGDALMVCRADQSGKVKDALNMVKERKLALT
ncbi:hypothetical protein A2415_05265 [candidate division WWE3 bacterium RIFOXYC1_FULL_39_7]|uniref:MannoseP isomerase/GMP-like beta-helix domain-containing protein n=1 Tax=candidate division WWE3 bacterium RIFOXYC1_FULL_39_7 TaxID=1802643 RepID=A0A1F4WJG6_UNCKA|nr:MAG: hypothetical protein A2415_05265 [candidate division WWE3 bacterium RIFOXYC1_FULL_39_7]